MKNQTAHPYTNLKLSNANSWTDADIYSDSVSLKCNGTHTVTEKAIHVHNVLETLKMYNLFWFSFTWFTGLARFAALQSRIC